MSKSSCPLLPYLEIALTATVLKLQPSFIKLSALFYQYLSFGAEFWKIQQS